MTHGRVAAVLIVAASAALLLTGCQDSPDPVASSVPQARPATTAASAPQSSSEPTATPTPVTLTCDQVLTAEQLGKLLPPLTAVAGFTPAKGTDAATAVADAGVACGYQNPSSGDTVAVSIAQPTDADLTSLKNKAIRSSHVVPTYGVPPEVMGYFDVDSTSGVAEVYTGDYWVVAESKDFHEPGDASMIMSDVIGNLP
jgi:hypothetical protein